MKSPRISPRRASPGSMATPHGAESNADSASSAWSRTTTASTPACFERVGPRIRARRLQRRDQTFEASAKEKRIMCGIVGMLDLNGRRDVSRELLSRINEAQHHRGPDECGLHVEPGVGLGHRRLSIIDVSTGQQPLYNEDGSVVIVYNGEIYNYQELIPELTALGHRFRTKSDTEVIVHAWEAWGEACVTHFRGMFAFALWDRNRSTLFLARDRLGVKPLHYALLPDIDPLAVEEYFALGYVAEPRSIFRQARKLPPAHTLTVRRGRPLPAP